MKAVPGLSDHIIMEDEFMKKRSLIVAALCSMCLALGNPLPVLADASKVVTLGADLTEAQKNTMMKYFKADASQVQIITVNNQDEHNYLGKYISNEQIGTRTLSCAYVKPTQSGGIKVRTANLNYVTCNMLANALSTAGVSNCEAVAACPYEVSGTGALTGVMMAYETASGKQLDSTKKDLATKEVVVTGDVAQQVGNDNATNIINQAKLQIIGDNIQNADEIYNIVNNIAIQNNVTLSADELNTITALLQEIVQQNYDIQEMKQTLESIQKNLDKATGNDSSSDDSDDEDEEIADEDSSDGEDITQDVATDELGPDVIESSTEDPNLAQDTGMNDSGSESSDSSTEDNMGIPEATEDGTQDTAAETPEEGESEDTTDENDGNTDIPEATGDETTGTDGSYDETTESGESTDTVDETTEEGTESSADDTLNTDSLDDASKAQFEQAQQFCQGEYQGDLATLQAVMADPVQPTVTLDSDTASKLTKKVLESYLNVLKDGGMSYVPSDTDAYMSGELNMINNDMKKIFSIETEPAADDILAAQPADARQSLYDETMRFFAQLYGEDTEDSSYNESTDEASYEEESYNEEY